MDGVRFAFRFAAGELGKPASDIVRRTAALAGGELEESHLGFVRSLRDLELRFAHGRGGRHRLPTFRHCEGEGSDFDGVTDLRFRPGKGQKEQGDWGQECFHIGNVREGVRLGKPRRKLEWKKEVAAVRVKNVLTQTEARDLKKHATLRCAMKSLPSLMVWLFLGFSVVYAQSPTPTPSLSPSPDTAVAKVATASPTAVPSPSPTGSPALFGIEIGEGSAAQKIVATTVTDKLRHLFTMRSSKSLSVTLAASPLRGPNNADFPVQLQIDGKNYTGSPITLSQSVILQGELDGSFPLTGKYEGYLTLSDNNGGKDLRKIEVTRSAGEAMATVAGLETVEYIWPCGDREFRFSIKENAGRHGGDYTPSIVSIARNVTGKKIQAHYENARVKPSPTDPRAFVAVIDGLCRAGEYAGIVRVTATDSLPFDQSFTILVKHSACLAGLAILLGVGLSYLLRKYTTEDRPRLVAKGQAVELLENVGDILAETADRTKTEAEVLQTLETRLNKLVEQIEKKDQVDFAAEIKSVKDKLGLVPKWISGRRAVDAIEPAFLQDVPRATLRSVGETLQKENPTDDEIKTARDNLTKLPGKIAELIKAELEKNLNALRDQVANEKERQKEDGAFSDRAQREVAPHLEATKNFLDRDQIDVARKEFEAARLAYAYLLTDDLLADIPPGSTPPDGFDPADWAKLHEEIRARLAAARALTVADAVMAEYKAAYEDYLRKLANALKAASDSWQQGLVQDQKNAAQAQIDNLATSRKSVFSKLLAGDLSGAAADYAAAVSQYEDLRDRMRPPGEMSGAEMAIAPLAFVPELGTLPAMVDQAQSARVSARLKETAAEIREKIQNYDGMVTLIVIIASVLIGLKMLWADEATWGSFKDYVTALLWGLGLHQVAFQSLEGLKDKLTK